MLVKIIIPKNDHIICREVRYPTSEKIDPDDTSDIFFEVLNSNGDEEYEEGDLVKFPHRHNNMIQIEGVKYTLLDKKQILSVLKKEYVKEDIIKR